MDLKQRLAEDLKTALKARDTRRVWVIRTLRAVIENVEIERNYDILKDKEIARQYEEYTIARQREGLAGDRRKPATKPKRPRHLQPVTEGEILQLIQHEIGQHQETLDYARQAQRADVIQREEEAISILQSYVPPQLTRDEIVAAVEQIIRKRGRHFDAVMPVAAQQLRGRADNRVVNQVVNQLVHGPGPQA